MGVLGSKQNAEKLKQKKIIKPQMPNSLHTPDAQFSFLICDLISRYIWDEKPESDILIQELIQSIRIRRYSDYFSYFKNNIRYIKIAERLYYEIVSFCQYENKWIDQDRKNAELTLIFLVNLYHIDKFRAIFVKSKRTWWIGTYFNYLKEQLQIQQDIENYQTEIVQILLEYFQKRNIELKPQIEEKKIDFTKIKIVADFYLQGLYKDNCTFLSDIDYNYQTEAFEKQQKYCIPQRLQLQ